MNRHVCLVFFACAILTAACPLAALAGATDGRYQHAAELLSLGNLQGAQTELQAILAERPDDKDAKLLLAVTLVHLSRKAAERGDTTTAQEVIGQALRLDPDEPYWHSIAAQLWSGQRETQRVARECSLAAQLSPDDDGLKQGRCPSTLGGFGAGQTNPHGVKAVVTHTGPSAHRIQLFPKIRFGREQRATVRSHGQRFFCRGLSIGGKRWWRRAASQSITCDCGGSITLEKCPRSQKL